ncbi:GspH/FimT family pseudopilin [Sphingomonas sp. NCPPB 2930]
MLALTSMRRAARGFTLIELMVTVAIVAILGMVAVPSFVAFQRNSELTSTSNSLLAAIGTARSEAMKRNMRVVVVPFSGTSWGNGWKVFADLNKDGKLSDSDTIVAQRDAPLPSYFATPAGTETAAAGTTDGPYIMFDGSGYLAKRDSGGAQNMSITFNRTDDTSAKQTRILLLSRPGRARVCTPSGANDATCNASAKS